MQVHYDEGVAIYIDPEPCVGVREDGDEASVREHRPGFAIARLRVLTPVFAGYGQAQNALKAQPTLRDQPKSPRAVASYCNDVAIVASIAEFLRPLPPGRDLVRRRYREDHMRGMIYTIATAMLALSAPPLGKPRLRIPPAIPIRSWADAFSLRRKICRRRKAMQSRQADLYLYLMQDRPHE